MDDMFYRNIGGKIKGWARAIFILGAIGAIFFGVYCIVEGFDHYGSIGDELVIIGFLTIILGPVAAWVSSWLLYAFGDLCENVSIMTHKQDEYETVESYTGGNYVKYIGMPPYSAKKSISSEWECRKCWKRNSDETTICAYCGAGRNYNEATYKTEMKICRACGEENTKTAMFCISCGERMK